MSDVRRALMWAASDKYLGLVVNFVYIAAMSRLLTPQEIGISALGVAVFGIAEALRDFGATAYLIQRKDVTQEDLQTTFTLLLLTSLALAGVLVGCAGPIAAYYREAGLATYVQVLAAGFLVGPFAGPVLALMRRDLEFRNLAAINVASATVNAAVAIALAMAGASYMSFAWAGLASAAIVPVLAYLVRPRPDIFRIRLRGSGEALRFGGIASVTTLLNRAYEALPLLILGRIAPFEIVGLFQRATMVCQLPDRFITTAVAPVVLPAFAATARTGGGLKSAYLRALTYVTAVQWPALLLLAFTAYPVVRLLLGPQWMAVAPIVQIMAVALLSMFPAMLTYPVLVAAGRIEDTLWSSLISLPLSVIALVPAAFLGIEAIAASMLVTLPLQVYVALSFIRRHVPFTWREVGAAVAPSGLVALMTMTGPLAVLAIAGFNFDLPIGAAIVMGVLAVPGWLAGLWLARHPLLGSLREIVGDLATRPAFRPIAQRLSLLPVTGKGPSGPA